jgi:hypothetical protein
METIATAIVTIAAAVNTKPPSTASRVYGKARYLKPQRARGIVVRLSRR